MPFPCPDPIIEYKGRRYKSAEFKDVLRGLDPAEMAPHIPGVNPVPSAPFAKTWHELAFKRVLRFAAEHGYDRVAWTTGEQQNARYSLDTHVDRIEYRPSHDARAPYAVRTYTKTHDQLAGASGNFDHARLAETFGQEMADKIARGEGTPGRWEGSERPFVLSGLDLKVGGGGMKGFYDQILPSYAAKYGKKWGATVGTTVVFTEPGYTPEALRGTDLAVTQKLALERGEGVPVHSLDVTPAMRQSVLGEGQPLFQGPQETAKGAVEFLADGRAIVRALQNPDASTGLHELAHIFRRDLEGPDLQVAETWAGVKDGKWSREQEEKFARGFEKWVRTGEAPTSRLAEVFAKFAAWLKAIYQRLQGSDINVILGDGMREVFANLFRMGEEKGAAATKTDLVPTKSEAPPAAPVAPRTEPEPPQAPAAAPSASVPPKAETAPAKPTGAAPLPAAAEHAKLSSGAASKTRGRAALARLRVQGFDVAEPEAALKEYEGTARKDFDAGEEYQEARQEAWQGFLDAVEGLEAPDERVPGRAQEAVLPEAPRPGGPPAQAPEVGGGGGRGAGSPEAAQAPFTLRKNGDVALQDGTVIPKADAEALADLLALSEGQGHVSGSADVAQVEAELGDRFSAVFDHLDHPDAYAAAQAILERRAGELQQAGERTAAAVARAERQAGVLHDRELVQEAASLGRRIEFRDDAGKVHRYYELSPEVTPAQRGEMFTYLRGAMPTYESRTFPTPNTKGASFHDLIVDEGLLPGDAYRPEVAKQAKARAAEKKAAVPPTTSGGALNLTPEETLPQALQNHIRALGAGATTKALMERTGAGLKDVRAALEALAKAGKIYQDTKDHWKLGAPPRGLGGGLEIATGAKVPEPAGLDFGAEDQDVSGKAKGPFASKAMPSPGSTPPAGGRPTPPSPGIPAATPATPAGTFSPQAAAVPWKAKWNAVLKVAAPVSSGGYAGKVTAAVLRRQSGQMAREGEVAAAALAAGRKLLGTLGVNANYAFADAVEQGAAQSTPELQAVADTLRNLLDQRRLQVQQFGGLQSFYENYFPHLWERPQAARSAFAGILGRRPLEGGKSFLKRRTILTFADGIQAGLKPVSDNAVDLVLLKLHEMDRYLLAHRTLADLKGRGLLRFFRTGAPAPEGWKKVDDAAFTVYGPPAIEIKEAYDRRLTEQLLDFAASLGVDVARHVSIGGQGRWGATNPAGDQILLKFGGPETQLTHEIGHAIDQQYDFHEFLMGVPAQSLAPGQKQPYAYRKVRKELAALARLRWEGIPEASVPKEFRRYVMQPQERTANLVHALVHAPDLAAQVAPTAVRRWGQFVRLHPNLRPLTNIKPSLTLAERVARVPIPLNILGNWYAPDRAALVLNNYLSPGLQGSPNDAIRSAYAAGRGASALMTQAVLGLSGFHAVVTSLNAMASDLGEAIGALAAGKPREAVLRALVAPTAVAGHFAAADPVMRAYRTPGSVGGEAEVLADALARAGGRITMDRYYQVGAIERLQKAFGRAAQYAQAGEGRAVPEVARTLFYTPFVALELASKPIMQYLVPRVKVGVFAELAHAELARLGPHADPLAVDRVLQEVWDSVDNRFGQLVYDNLFWDKTLKDLGFLTVLSLGWNVGTLREMQGGKLDLAGIPALGRRLGPPPGGTDAEGFPNTVPGDNERSPWFTHRARFLIGELLGTALLGAVTAYLLTGDRPRKLLDYFYPPTGKTLPNGEPERLVLPTYLRDDFAWALHPVGTAQGKANVGIVTLLEFLANRDFKGEEIRDPQDPLVQQAKDVAKHLAERVTPISIQKGLGRGEKAGAGSLFGLNPAPSYITNTPAEQLLYKFRERHREEGPKTHAEAAKARTKAKIRKDFREHSPEGAADVAAAVKEGAIAPKARAVAAVIKGAHVSPLEAGYDRLTVPEAIQVAAVANARELPKLLPKLARKIVKEWPAVSPAQFDLDLKRLRTLRDKATEMEKAR